MVSGDNSPRRRRTKLTVERAGDTTNGTSKWKRGLEKKKRQREPSFVVLVVQVGTTLAVLCVIFYTGYRWWFPLSSSPNETAVFDDDDAIIGGGEYLAANVDGTHYQGDEIETVPPMPIWNLTERSHFDAFSIAESYRSSSVDRDQDSTNNSFWVAATGLLNDFSEAYGGDNSARALLQRATTVFGRHQGDEHAESPESYPSYLESVTCRIQNAKNERRPFRFAFGGYSVTAGRGNYFSQSFPFVMEKLLHTVFSLAGVQLQVRNAAIGGCPSFPYGWCMPNFWGNESLDVVSWDYSMNEAGGDPSGLEAYLRHALQLPSQPMLIVKDTHTATERRELLREYVDLGILRDPLVVHTDPAARPFLDRREEHRPEGFREWRKFGSPPGAPGQVLHHPAVKEHIFIASILAMHFLAALELFVLVESGVQLQLKCPFVFKDDIRRTDLPQPILPEALNPTKPWESILFGERVGNGDAWRMNPVHCRTSFEPNVFGDLSDVVVSGTVADEIDIMLPKSKMFYNRGWVLDLSDGEKKAKRKLDRFGGLGFLDSKKAYYALRTSRSLRLLLPFYPPRGGDAPKIGDQATDWFKSILWCEVNEKRGQAACKTETDVHFQIGTLNVTRVVGMDAPGGLYLGNKVCTYLTVPHGARLTNRKILKQNETSRLIVPVDLNEEVTDELVGLVVEATVMNQHIIHREDACSVSHVVWEQVTR